MFAKPEPEHEWLSQLVGDWKFFHDCRMPDGSTSKAQGSMNCRSLGGLWLICESTGESEDDEPWSSIMTLGFDSEKKQYVGTFVASMMPNVWLYHGVLDADGKRLPLNSEGPSFDGNGRSTYRDIITIVDSDHWLFDSEVQGEDGNWTQFLYGKHERR